MGAETSNMLIVDNLSVFYGEIQALWDITLDIKEGSITAIVGSNGAGKSTLLNTIAGLVQLNSGDIIWEGNSIVRYAPYQRVEAGISLVPERRRLFPYMTIMENLELGAYIKRAKVDAHKNLEWVFQLFPVLKKRANQLAGTLSGGEQQMAAIARGLMSQPRLLMLDEPSQGLAPMVALQVLRQLEELNQAGLTILIVEQNIRQTLTIANMAFVLESGRLVLKGSGEELLGDGHVKKAYLGL